MKLRKYLLLPRLLLLAARAPRDQRLAWDRYWSEVARTGFDGDVLWDAGEPTELTESAKRLYAHADPDLPIVDLGCGKAGRHGNSPGTRHGCWGWTAPPPRSTGRVWRPSNYRRPALAVCNFG
ncbi:MAG TPA: hypothetical protein VJ301_20245 [Propionibacteriaceae bacterium]|nr:hypothetical protein [Propionibacteriaceae bacterium]